MRKERRHPHKNCSLHDYRQHGDPFWTQSLAVGGREFVDRQRQLGKHGRYRQIESRSSRACTPYATRPKLMAGI